MNSRLLISHSQKYSCNDQKADAGNAGCQNFPSLSKIDHINTGKQNQNGGMMRVGFFFKLNASDFSLFSKELLSSEKISCYEKIFSPQLLRHDGIGDPIYIAVEVKRYLRSKKRNVHTPCLFLAKEFG
jgi:hypothetical protein